MCSLHNTYWICHSTRFIFHHSAILLHTHALEKWEKTAEKMTGILWDEWICYRFFAPHDGGYPTLTCTFFPSSPWSIQSFLGLSRKSARCHCWGAEDNACCSVPGLSSDFADFLCSGFHASKYSWCASLEILLQKKYIDFIRRVY